jgi:DNA-binding beta-propeller fold protein YncE
MNQESPQGRTRVPIIRKFVRRLGQVMAIVLPIAFWMACGQVYRPVVIPCSTGGVPGCPVEPNPSPSNFHTVFGISSNSPNYPGGAIQIDVSGDSVIGQTPTYDPSKPNLGVNPTNAAISPNDSRVFVTSAGSVQPGGVDVLSSFTPAFQTTIGVGLGAVSTISLPAGSQPVFVTTTQTTEAYVANFATNSVSSINTVANVLLNTVPVGVNPVAMAETPNAFKLYVANQGGGNSTCGPICSLNPTDLSQNVVTGFTGVTPVWVVARKDSQKVYVVTAGDGQLVTIDVASDTVTSSLPVGTGANFLFYDPNLNRIYVVNPVTQAVYVFSATGANDTPTLLSTISFAAGSTACSSGCTPVGVTALLDGTRFYVASYQTAATTCPDANVAGPCVIPGLTVFDANSLSIKYPSAPTIPLLGFTPFAANQYAVPPVASCATAALYPALYSPTVTRFRMFTVSSSDSSRVYVGMCDAGAIAVINTTGNNKNNSENPLPPDTVVIDVPEAPAASSATALQNPMFMLVGQ